LGTELFKGQYIVATKTFGSARNIEASIGYGNKRPDGVFGGVRWAPLAMPGWAAVAEYDANDYPRISVPSETSAGQAPQRAGRRPRIPLGLARRAGCPPPRPLQRQRLRQHSRSRNASSSQAARAGALRAEESAGARQRRRVAAKTRSHGAALVQALAKQNFKNIRVELDGGTLKLTLTNNRISNMGRAVGAPRARRWRSRRKARARSTSPTPSSSSRSPPTNSSTCSA
jgi:hypothetical protein